MREFKFRYRGADGAPFYKTVTLPDTVAQLVGFDKNGNEVYEGDTVIGADDMEWVVDMTSCVTSEEGFVHDIKLDFFTLKEDDQ